MFGHFLFRPGEWLGAGQVTFSASPDLLYFRTHWSIALQEISQQEIPQEAEDFHCTQKVEIIGGDTMVNIFSVLPMPDENGFEILLTNEYLGVFDGAGVVEEGLVAWEFRHKGMFEGFEVYERTSACEYQMHAEYLASDNARTMIVGKIWKRGGEKV